MFDQYVSFMKNKIAIQVADTVNFDQGERWSILNILPDRIELVPSSMKGEVGVRLMPQRNLPHSRRAQFNTSDFPTNMIEKYYTITWAGMEDDKFVARYRFARTTIKRSYGKRRPAKEIEPPPPPVVTVGLDELRTAIRTINLFVSTNPCLVLEVKPDGTLAAMLEL